MDKHSHWIGLTGGIATGKTEVLKLLRRQGFPVVSADALAHTCLRKGHPVYRSIVRRWGRAILGKNRQIDRKKLGALVFTRPQERQRLEQWIHPWVKRGMKTFARRHRGPIIMEIPLLYEAGWDPWLDKVIVIVSSRATQLKRLRRRNGLARAAALKRLGAQWPLSRKVKRADYVLRNNGTRKALALQVAVLKKKLLSR